VDIWVYEAKRLYVVAGFTRVNISADPANLFCPGLSSVAE
jgi:hypothetical protein